MRYVMVWVTMLGIAATIYRGEEMTAGHARLRSRPGPCRRCCTSFGSHLVFAAGALLAWYGFPFALSVGNQVSPAAQIPDGGALPRLRDRRCPDGGSWRSACDPRPVRAIAKASSRPDGHLLITLSASFALLPRRRGADRASRSCSPAPSASWRWTFRLRAIPSRMFAGIDSFVLLAAPFYILTGELMSRGGITERLIALSMMLTRASPRRHRLRRRRHGPVLLRHLGHGRRATPRRSARSSSGR